MSDRLSSLETIVAEIRGSQAEIIGGQQSVNRAIDSIQQSLAILADLRAETLHIIKTQKRDQEAHDEIFQRLREGEKKCNVQGAAIESAAVRVKGLESNQRWGVITLLGLIIVEAFRRIFVP